MIWSGVMGKDANCRGRLGMPGNKPIKILFCIDALVRGGTELQLLGLIDRLDRSRFSPHLLTIRPTPAELNPDNCPHLEWNVPRLLAPGGVRDTIRLARYLRREKFDVVQTFFQDSTIFGGVAARLAGVPVRLACFRDLGFWRTRNQALLLHRVYPMMTGFLSNAAVVKRNFVEHDGLRADDITVIYNGIETSALPWVEHTGPTLHIGIVGNLTRHVKRTDLFIKAAAMVSRIPGGENVTWHIIGDGDFRTDFENLARAEGIADQVVFTGRISDVAGYLEKLQVGVLCSDSEGFSNALLEYMFKGCACVATDVGGNSEAIEDMKTGLLVPPDNAEALAVALGQLVTDPVLRQSLAGRARQFVAAEFNWEKCVAEHESVYLDRR
jgi:L-malate glycosyltransferase